MIEEENHSIMNDKWRWLYKVMYPLSLLFRTCSVMAIYFAKLTAIICPFVIMPITWCYRDKIQDATDWKWVSTLVSLGLISVLFSNVKDAAWGTLKSIIKNLKEDNHYTWIPCLDLPKAWKYTKINFRMFRLELFSSLLKGWALSLLLVLGIILALAMHAAQSMDKSENRYHVVVASMEKQKTSEIKKYLVKGDTVFSLVHMENANASGDGICLTKYEELWLTEFRDAINECASKSEAHDMPHLEITGFASSAPVTPHNKKVNCEFSNRRAMAVAGFLTGNEKWKWKCNEIRESHSLTQSLCDPSKIEETCEGNGLRIKLRQWSSHADMVAHKPVNDGTSSDGKTSVLEFFNRSVHIKIPKDFCRIVDRTGEQGQPVSAVVGDVQPVPLRDKLDAHLLALVEGHAAGDLDRATSYARSKGLDVREGRIPVQMLAASEQHVPALEQRINSVGGSVRSHFENSIFAAIPLQALGEIAADDAVWRIDAERCAFAPQTRDDAKP